MAKQPGRLAGRPAVRIGRVFAGAVVAAARRALVVLPMAAVAFAGPLLATIAVTAAYPRATNIALDLLIMAGVTVLRAALMQALLVEAATIDLRRVKPSWEVDTAASARRFFGDLVLNLIALGLVCIAFAGGGMVVGVSRSIAASSDPNSGWWAVAGTMLGALPMAGFLSRWAVAIPLAHVEALSIVDALKRSAALTRGYRLRITLLQSLNLAAWPAALLAMAYSANTWKLKHEISVAFAALICTLLGVFWALDALGKVRLYRELATVEGAVGSANLADVFA